MRNGYQDVSPPEQLHDISEYLSDVHDKFTHLVSMLGQVAHEQLHMKQVLDEVKSKQNGSHSILESVMDTLHSAKRDIVVGPQCVGKPANEQSQTQFGLARPEHPQSARSRFECSRHVDSVNMDDHDRASSLNSRKRDKKRCVNKFLCEQGLEVNARTPTLNMRTLRNAAKGSSVVCDVAGSRRLSCANVQLNRQRFTERCFLEVGLLSNLFTVCNFFVMLALYLYVQATSDPVELVSGIHAGLRDNFWIGDDKYGPEACHSPDDIMEYTQRFIVQSFEMASALIETIDMDRCLPSDWAGRDICRLKYWRFPESSHKQNYFNKTLFDRDKLTSNNAMSVMDCAASPPKLNCINRSDARFVASGQGTARTFGLTPEDPIIMDSSMDYPYASVIPLTPIVWQARASRVDCVGFGDQYNKDILGAGDCQANISCDPGRVTEFSNAKDNLFTDRRQSIFVTYEKPAFTCVDRRPGKEAHHFKDRSWSPWATFEDLTKGRSANKGTVRGQEIFWKFVPDVAYLQAPHSEILFRDHVLSPCNIGDVSCLSHSVHCRNPLKDPSHPMWGESNYTHWQCSYHRHFANEYYFMPSRGGRKNTFLTIETSEFTMAAIIITPSSIDFQDIITLLTVTFSISQSGYISASSDMVSVSEKLTQWYINLVVLFTLSGTYFLCSVKGTSEFFCSWWKTSDKWNKDVLAVFDMLLSLSVIGHSLVALFIDKMPPHVIEEVMDALKINNQQAYFDVINTIIDYQATSNNMRDIGFVIALLLFLRLNMYLSLHPRLAILARTIKDAGDDMFHLAVYCLLLMLFLTVLAWWSFGHDSDAFSTIARSAYMLIRMLVGESLFADVDKPPPVKRLLFFLIYIFIVFFILLNFFLAIIVNMYTEIQTLKRTVNVVDNSLPVDIYDLFKTKMLLISDTLVDKSPVLARFLERYLNFNLKGRVADPRHLLSYLMHEGCGLEETAAVTPEELLEVRVNGKAFFTTMEQAELCIRAYIKKVWVLEERNPVNLYTNGSYFDHRDPAGSRPGLTREWLCADDETTLQLTRDGSMSEDAGTKNSTDEKPMTLQCFDESAKHRKVQVKLPGRFSL